MKRVLLFRHGDIVGRTDTICAGSTDALLSAEGISTSLVNINYLNNRHQIDRVLSSTRRRTRLPGIHLQKHEGTTHEAMHGLNELDFGPEWEGKTWREICMKHGDALHEFKRTPHNHRIPGAEPWPVFQQRVLETWREIIRQEFDELAIFAHSLVNSVILNETEGSDRWTFRQKLSCLNEIQINRRHQASITRANVTLYS